MPVFSAFVLLLATFASAPAEQGFAPEWDIRPVLQEISAHFGRVLPVLDRVDSKAWVAKGAPEMYISQLNSVKAQARALSNEATELSRNPEKLSAALQVFFRMQYVEVTLISLEDGVRRYQNAALADELSRLAAENGANRERFQKHIVDVAAAREQEFQVADHEAQRCRAFLSMQPGGTPAKTQGK